MRVRPLILSRFLACVEGGRGTVLPVVCDVLRGVSAFATIFFGGGGFGGGGFGGGGGGGGGLSQGSLSYSTPKNFMLSGGAYGS
jgi:hypothetical protein